MPCSNFALFSALRLDKSTAATDASTKTDKALADAKEYADGKANELADRQVATNKTDIATLQGKVESLESVTYTPITEAEINSLFEYFWIISLF